MKRQVVEDQKISYQTAKLANLKGIDPDIKLRKNSHYSDLTEKLDPLGISGSMMVLHHYYAFTQSQLQKILRENHGINVYCVPTDEDPNIWFHNIAASFRVFTGTYEETLENALQEALKLI